MSRFGLQAFRGQRTPSCMAPTNKLPALCSITTETVARATSRPSGLGPGTLTPTSHWLLAQVLMEQPSLVGAGGWRGRMLCQRIRQEACLGLWGCSAGLDGGGREQRVSESLASLSLPGSWSPDFSSRDPAWSPYPMDQGPGQQHEYLLTS